jgi:hypothetical protein
MTIQKQSASTPTFASTALPAANVIAFAPPRGAFTKTGITKMRCPAGKQEELFWDKGCRGFGLRALASGRRTWIYQYRDEHRRTRRIALGDVSAVNLDPATKQAVPFRGALTALPHRPAEITRSRQHQPSYQEE